MTKDEMQKKIDDLEKEVEFLKEMIIFLKNGSPSTYYPIIIPQPAPSSPFPNPYPLGPWVQISTGGNIPLPPAISLFN